MKKIPFSKICCDGNELKYIKDVIDSGWLTTARKCQEFERQFARKIDSKYVCAVNSGTAALHLACESLGLKPGDKVFVPTMTFTASAEVLRYLGVHPIFVDVEYSTCLLTPDILKFNIEKYKEAKAVILVHFGGQAAHMDGILELCQRHQLKLIEDAAHAFPTKYNHKMIGTFGDVTCFSFYANKTITTGEGGMLATQHEDIYNRVRTMRLHGINRSIWDRFTKTHADWDYDVVAPGYKYNLSDLAAAIGLAQLERADEFRSQRKRCISMYLKHLRNIQSIDLPLYHCSLDSHSCHLFWIVLNQNCPLERDEFIFKLNSAGIGTSVHYKPLHRMTYYKRSYKLNSSDYPNAERHWRGVVTLPVYPSLSNDDIIYICDEIKQILS